MDVSFVIRRRLEEFGLDQRDLARAAQVTESYISQLLTRKKAPPAPNRTDIYDKMDKFLKLEEVRALILRKCRPEREKQMRAVFEKEPFGEIERLVTQKLLEVVKRVAKEELANEYWLRMVAELGGRSYEEVRVAVLQFLDADILDVSVEDCISFLDPLIDFWDFDLTTFGLEIGLNQAVAADPVKRFEFVERDSDPPPADEPGLKEFLRDASLSATVTEAEIEFLKRLRVKGRRPTALYYYRELQNLRDPLHFRQSPAAT